MCETDNEVRKGREGGKKEEGKGGGRGRRTHRMSTRTVRTPDEGVWDIRRVG